MTRIIVTRGLPASGKSTWAKAWVSEDPDNRVRVNRDDIRFALFGKYTGVDENFVTKVEEETVRAALKAGKDVVVDAMHLKAAYVKKWLKFGPVTVQEFPIPVEDAVLWDQRRMFEGDRGVGEGVILSLAKRFHIPAKGTLPRVDLTAEAPPQFTPAPEWDFDLPNAIIVDTDGTLANHEPHRSPYDPTKYHLDTVFEDVRMVVHALGDSLHILGVSGRDDTYRDVTVKWWLEHGRLTPDEFYMRAAGDTRKDDIVKAEIFDKHIAGRYNVIGVFDDRPRVCRMWRAKGLTTFQVGDPDNEF